MDIVVIDNVATPVTTDVGTAVGTAVDPPPKLIGVGVFSGVGVGVNAPLEAMLMESLLPPVTCTATLAELTEAPVPGIPGEAGRVKEVAWVPMALEVELTVTKQVAPAASVAPQAFEPRVRGAGKLREPKETERPLGLKTLKLAAPVPGVGLKIYCDGLGFKTTPPTLGAAAIIEPACVGAVGSKKVIAMSGEAWLAIIIAAVVVAGAEA